jgi:hypothetical protein
MNGEAQQKRAPRDAGPESISTIRRARIFSTFFNRSFTTFRTATNSVLTGHHQGLIRTRGGHMRKNPEGDWLSRAKRLMTVAMLGATLASAAPSSTRIAFAAQNSTIFVSDVDELYAAVNNPENAAAAIFLAPGVYVLSARDATGTSRPNGGRLDLQLDMSLHGVAGDRAKVLIDANRRDEFGNRLLPQSSFAFTVGRTGIIRTGRGNNTIEWLTIAGNPLAAASISTDLVQTDGLFPSSPLPTSIRVAHVAAGDSARGVDIRNATAATKGRRIVAEIEDSDFYWGVEGIRVANFVDANDAEISVDLRGNRSYKNRLGCILENNRSSNASVAVRSYGDRFEDNGLGCMVGGGLVGTQTGAANFNTARFDAYGSRFTNNTRRNEFNTEAGGPMFADLGGIVVDAAIVLSTGAPNSTSSNTAIVRLWDAIVADNVTIDTDGNESGADFAAFGARCLAAACEADPPALPGTDNHVLIQLRGLSALLEIGGNDNGINTVTVVRIPEKKPGQ